MARRVGEIYATIPDRDADRADSDASALPRLRHPRPQVRGAELVGLGALDAGADVQQRRQHVRLHGGHHGRRAATVFPGGVGVRTCQKSA